MTRQPLEIAIAALTEISKQTERVSGYGYFLGGDPRDFFPDSESCTPEEIKAHAEAVHKWNLNEANGVTNEDLPCKSGPMVINDTVVWATASDFGIGGYDATLPTHAAMIARQALKDINMDRPSNENSYSRQST
jgi:hypothetical protein